MATALLAFAGASCVEPLEPVERDPNAQDLIIRLSVPGQGIPVTKALTGPVNGINPESQVYSVQVWMFNHPKDAVVQNGQIVTPARGTDDETAVAYAKVNLGTNGWANTAQRVSGYYDAWSNSTTYEVPMTIPGYILDRPVNDLKFDFYVLANASSIGIELDQRATRGELKNSSFGGNNFGTTNPKTGTIPPKTETIPSDILGSTGLPISGFFNKTKAGSTSPYVGPDGGVDLSFLKTQPNIMPANMHKLVPVVQLKRAVSKIRFAFARPTGMADIQITKIVIDEKLIPASTFVFPRENGTEFELPNGSGYTTGAATIGSDDSPLFVVPKNYTGSDIIAAVSDPEALKSNSEKKLTTNQAKTPSQMDAQEYDTFLSAHSTSQVVYLRESDKPITGKIYYKIGADTYEEPFTMEGLTNTNFHRNHYWTVYAYFMGGKLYVKPTVKTDWVDADVLNYTMKMNTNMRLFDSWLYRYDTDGKAYLEPDPNNENKPFWNNWATSHMAVSEGRETDGRPSRSPQIQLVTTGEYTFDLVVDNSDFEIVRANKNDTGVVTGYQASVDGKLRIAAGDDVYTYFYIVPKADVITPSNLVAKVSLIYNDDVLGPQKVTYNYNSLPGYSDDSSEIWAYFFAASDYNITNKLRMYFQDNNHPLVPTTVQN